MGDDMKNRRAETATTAGQHVMVRGIVTHAGLEVSRVMFAAVPGATSASCCNINNEDIDAVRVRPTAPHTVPEQCPECEGTGAIEACDPFPAMKCHACEPPSEDVLRIVHAFDDQERKDAVRELGSRVKATEAALQTHRRELQRLHWMRDVVGVDVERMFARALKEKDGREQRRERATPKPLDATGITDVIGRVQELLDGDVIDDKTRSVLCAARGVMRAALAVAKEAT
jgi:hypothetical protein